VPRTLISAACTVEKVTKTNTSARKKRLFIALTLLCDLFIWNSTYQAVGALESCQSCSERSRYRERGLPSMPMLCVRRVAPVPSVFMTKISVSKPVVGRDDMK
jgi:hypothetical protein